MSEMTAKGNQLLRGERLQIMLEKVELEALDDFRFSNRLPSRAAAVRELLRRGLAAEGFAIEQPEGASRSFGVLNGNGGSEGNSEGA
jgi:hypothetical protein